MTFVLAFLVGGLGVLALHTLDGVGGASRDGIFDQGIYGVLMGGAALTVLARGVLVKAQRAAWLTMGGGLVCWCLGDLYYTLFGEGTRVAGGSVTPADALYLVFYPCCYVALVLLVGAHMRELRIGMWLDGLIGGLAAGSGRRGGGAAADPRPRARRCGLDGGRAGVPDRRPAAADLRDRRARDHGLAARAGVAAGRGEHAGERDRGLGLPLPDGDEQLPDRGLGAGAVADLDGTARDRGVDAVAAADAPARGGLAAGVGPGVLAAGGAGGVRVRQPAPSADPAGAGRWRSRRCSPCACS